MAPSCLAGWLVPLAPSCLVGTTGTGYTSTRRQEVLITVAPDGEKAAYAFFRPVQLGLDMIGSLAKQNTPNVLMFCSSDHLRLPSAVLFFLCPCTPC